MQQVNFPIEFIIAEDCSTDGTLAICKEYAEKYPDLIKLITSENNVGAIANERRAMKEAKGQYIAFCEGDDYWTDPLKLQKQVDFLEEYPEYSVTFHRCKHYNVVDDTIKDDQCGFLFQNNEEGVDVTVEMFFEKWITQPLTMVYRASMFDLDDMLKYKYYRDMHQIYHLLMNGKGYLFEFEGGVRIVHGGGMHSMIVENKQTEDAYIIAKEIYIKNKNNITKEYLISTIKWILNFRKGLKRIIPSLQLFKLDRNCIGLLNNFLRCFQ
jgi:glycosyltransferase involved in cell wall biosynthesis